MEIRFYDDKSKYYELSNYYLTKFTLNGITYKSSEHYYQAHRYPENSPYFNLILAQNTANKTRILSRRETPNYGYAWVKELNKLIKENPAKPLENFDNIRLQVMRTAVYAKFNQNPQLKKLLIETHSKKLVEASPRDDFWGIGKNGDGKNMLGKILMEVRDLFIKFENINKSEVNREELIKNLLYLNIQSPPEPEYMGESYSLPEQEQLIQVIIPSVSGVNIVAESDRYFSNSDDLIEYLIDSINHNKRINLQFDSFDDLVYEICGNILETLYKMEIVEIEKLLANF